MRSPDMQKKTWAMRGEEEEMVLGKNLHWLRSPRRVAMRGVKKGRAQGGK